MKSVAMDDTAESSPALKAFSLLEIVAGMDHPPTLAELTEAAGWPKPTLHRWLTMLEGADLLRRMPDGRRYESAARATALAFAILSNNSGSTQRHQILERVVRTLGESCNLTVLEGNEVMYLDRVDRIRRDAYAFDDEEFLSGLFCVAVPIFDRSGRDCIAALALQAPVVRVSRANAAEHLPTLREAAEALAVTLR